MNNDVLPVFTDIHKYLSLIMSDKVSSMLKLNFDMKDVNCKFEEYREFTADVNQFSYIGLFKFKNRGLLLFFDSKIIYVLCNRMLGGHGLAETKPKPVFTFSESFFAEKMLTMFFDFFKDTKLNVNFLRSEKNLDLIHFCGKNIEKTFPEIFLLENELLEGKSLINSILKNSEKTLDFCGLLWYRFLKCEYSYQSLA